MKVAELLNEQVNFNEFIGYMRAQYDELVKQLPTNRLFVIGACRRAIKRLSRYPTTHDGERMLIEIAIESFTELLQKAGGNAQLP